MVALTTGKRLWVNGENPSKCLKNKQVIILANKKEVVVTADAQTTTTIPVVATNLIECSEVVTTNLAANTPKPAKLANRSSDVAAEPSTTATYSKYFTKYALDSATNFENLVVSPFKVRQIMVPRSTLHDKF